MSPEAMTLPSNDISTLTTGACAGHAVVGGAHEAQTGHACPAMQAHLVPAEHRDLRLLPPVPQDDLAVLAAAVHRRPCDQAPKEAAR